MSLKLGRGARLISIMILVVLTLFISSVTAAEAPFFGTFLYDEDADVINYTGLWYNPGYITDGNWDANAGYPDGYTITSLFFFNYSYSITAAKWETWNKGGTRQNSSITSTCLVDDSIVELRYRSINGSSAVWECENGSEWLSVRVADGTNGGQYLIEEALWYPGAQDTQNATGVYNNTAWTIDLNCSDPDESVIQYHVNETVVDIDNESGVINVTGTSPGNYTNIGVFCNDSTNDTWQVFDLEILDMAPPTFDQDLVNISVNHLTSGTFDVNCSDNGGETIGYLVNDTYVTIDNDTGVINITADINQTGNYSGDILVTCNTTLDEIGQVFNVEILNHRPTMSLPWIGANYNWTNDTSLVAYLRLDGNALDETGVNNGTVNGAVINHSGRLGYAYQFDGLNDHIDLTADNSYNFDLIDRFSFSFWVYPNSLSGTQGMMGKYATVSPYYSIRLYNNLARMTIYNGSSGAYQHFDSSFTVSTNWVYLTTTWNTTHVCWYKDGEFNRCIANTQVGGTITSLKDLSIGNGGGGTNDFNGTIDEVMIFNRSLSASEISTIYNISKGNYSRTDNDIETALNATVDVDQDFLKPIYGNWYLDGEPQILLNMPFERNGSSGNHTEDYSGLGYHGYPVNATWNLSGGYDGWGAYEFDGLADNINVGDISSLNSASELSISFFMNQKELDKNDYLFMKYKDVDNHIAIHTHTDGDMYFRLTDNSASEYGHFDYSTVINANSWHHIVGVFDGAEVGNANRLKLFVDGELVTLTFEGDIDSITSDLTGIDAIIGYESSSFNGTIDEVMIFNRSLTPAQIANIYNNQSYKISMYETTKNHNWSSLVYVHDGWEPSAPAYSDNISIKNARPNFDQDTINGTIYHNHEWVINLNATDVDGDVLTFTVNTTFVDINNSGDVNITPSILDTWLNYTNINVTVNDSDLGGESWQMFDIEIWNSIPLLENVTLSIDDKNNATNSSLSVTWDVFEADSDNVNNYTYWINLSTYYAPTYNNFTSIDEWNTTKNETYWVEVCIDDTIDSSCTNSSNITIDGSQPYVNVTSPEDAVTYHSRNIFLNWTSFSLTNESHDTTYVSLNNGANFTFGHETNSNLTINDSIDGQYNTLTIFTLDEIGNTYNSTHRFFVNTSTVTGEEEGGGGGGGFTLDPITRPQIVGNETFPPGQQINPLSVFMINSIAGLKSVIGEIGGGVVSGNPTKGVMIILSILITLTMLIRNSEGVTSLVNVAKEERDKKKAKEIIKKMKKKRWGW